MFKEEVDKRSAEFISEFNNIIITMSKPSYLIIGEKHESARDLCFFLVKEVGKAFAYMQIVLKEYHMLSRIKDFLYAEVSAYQIENAIAQS